MTKDEAKDAYRRAIQNVNEASEKVDDLHADLENAVINRENALTKQITAYGDCKKAGVTSEEIKEMHAEWRLEREGKKCQ